MEKIKRTNFEDGIEIPDGLEMFHLLCVENSEGCGLGVSFGFAKDEAQLELMKSIGKEKEYQDYLKTVSRTMEPVFDVVNEITINFIKKNVFSNHILAREELDTLLSRLLVKAILGGRK